MFLIIMSLDQISRFCFQLLWRSYKPKEANHKNCLTKNNLRNWKKKSWTPSQLLLTKLTKWNTKVLWNLAGTKQRIRLKFTSLPGSTVSAKFQKTILLVNLRIILSILKFRFWMIKIIDWESLNCNKKLSWQNVLTKSNQMELPSL